MIDQIIGGNGEKPSFRDKGAAMRDAEIRAIDFYFLLPHPRSRHGRPIPVLLRGGGKRLFRPKIYMLYVYQGD
jgi:hypothetical protein